MRKMSIMFYLTLVVAIKLVEQRARLVSYILQLLEISFFLALCITIGAEQVILKGTLMDNEYDALLRCYLFFNRHYCQFISECPQNHISGMERAFILSLSAPYG